MRHSSLLLALSILAAVPTAAQPQQGRFAGCYDVAIGPWTPDGRIGPNSLYTSPPPRIRLDSLPSPDDAGRDVLKVHPAPGSPPSIHRFATWQVVGGDSVLIVFTTGFSGFLMRLAPRGRDLHGRAQSTWDFTRERETAPAVARRVSCSAPPRREWASIRRLPRGIRLEGGRSVALGRTLGDGGLALEENAREVRAKPVGAFAGATRVEAHRTPPGYIYGDGHVYQINLFYPSDIDLDRLTRRLTAALGSPTSQGDGKADWFGVDARIILTRSQLTSGGTEVRLVMSDPRGP